MPSEMTYRNHLVHLENSKDFRYNTPLILLLGKLKFYSAIDMFKKKKKVHSSKVKLTFALKSMIFYFNTTVLYAIIFRKYLMTSYCKMLINLSFCWMLFSDVAFPKELKNAFFPPQHSNKPCSISSSPAAEVGVIWSFRSCKWETDKISNRSDP